MLSFLFKYPLSSLTREERNEIEVLIKYLILNKPNFTGWNTFEIGLKLFAGICGTIVTYVLVALQFHLQGSKKNTNRYLSSYNVTVK